MDKDLEKLKIDALVEQHEITIGINLSIIECLEANITTLKSKIKTLNSKIEHSRNWINVLTEKGKE